jgi:hypothetical protein
MRDETGEVIFINIKSTKTGAKACNSLLNPFLTRVQPILNLIFNHFNLI